MLPAMTLRKATNQETRRTNVRLVLRTIYDGGPISRAEVARATGLTRTTVSGVVDDLLDDGLTEEIGLGRSTGGKAPMMLRVPPDARHLIGIDVDVDGDRLRGAVIDLRGDIHHRSSYELPDSDGKAALDILDTLVDDLVAAAEHPLLGIGVGTPGLVETASGVVRRAVGLDWRDVALGERIAKRTALPAMILNDSQAVAMAEWMFGRHDASADMVVVKLGKGIGAGIVLDGQLRQGGSSGAGEIGHSRVLDGGPACRCGNSGCLETVASARAVIERATRLSATRGDSRLAEAPVTHTSLVTAFREADPLAREIVLDAAIPLGRILGAVVGTLDIRDIVLVGQMTAYGEPYLDAIRAEFARSALPILAERGTIHFGRSGEEAVMLGAAAMLMTSELGLTLPA